MTTTVKIILIALAAASLLLISGSADSATVISNYSAVFGINSAAFLYAAQTALQNADLPNSFIKLALSQVLFETGNFNPTQSNLASQYNNFSGIVFLNEPSVQLNAYKGPAQPGTSYYFAGFITVNDWAIDYKRILGDYGIDFSETDVNTVAQELSDNGYYTSSESSYAAGMQHYFDMLTEAGL